MTETNRSTSGNWTSTQAYVLSVICLLAGVAVGYLVRGSAPTQTTEASAVAQAQPGGPMAPLASPQQPTPEELRRMADTQARPLLEQLKAEPKNALLLYKIGNLYYDAQQYPEAVNYYESSLKINPNATDVRTDLGTAYHLVGQPDKAIQEFEEVLKIDDKYANALFNEGMVKWQDKMDIQGAVASWKRLLATNPDYHQKDRVQQLISQAEQHQNLKAGVKPDKSVDASQ